MRHSRTLCFAFLVLGNLNPLLGAEIKIVSPPAFENTEGSEATSPFCPEFLRYQQVFPSEDFGTLPGGRGLITGFAWRPDAFETEALTVGPVHWILRLSTTGSGPGNLRTGFSDNMGADEVTVFDGELTIQTNHVGPPQGPKVFDYIVNFQRPFFYVETRGNLLLDYIYPDAICPNPRADWYVGPTAAVYTFSRQAGTGELLRGGIVHQFTFQIVDIDSLQNAIRAQLNDRLFDLNNNGLVDLEDQSIFIHDIKNTWVGDANFDGEFNSGYLIAVFQVGQYEDSVMGNSTWSTGDWSGNGEFDSADLALAFQDGGYEKGQRPLVAPVPEPSSNSVVGMASAALLFCLRRNWQTKSSARRASTMITIRRASNANRCGSGCRQNSDLPMTRRSYRPSFTFADLSFQLCFFRIGDVL